MRVGYARVSTNEQDIAGQLSRLADCERVFAEKQSGKLRDRKELAACLAFVREGDTLVVTRLDRLGRSMTNLCEINALLKGRGVELVVLDQRIDTRSPEGKLYFHIVAAFAEFELGLRREAQAAGIAHARERGKQFGRRYLLSESDRAALVQRYTNGEAARSLARAYHISPRTVRRYASEAIPPPS